MKTSPVFNKFSFSALVLGCSVSVQAAEELDLLDTLVAKKILSQSEADSLRAQQAPDYSVLVSRKGLLVESADKQYSLKLGGRIHADYAHNEHDTLAGGADAIDGT